MLTLFIILFSGSVLISLWDSQGYTKKQQAESDARRAFLLEDMIIEDDD
jgi:hypothetical protein